MPGVYRCLKPRLFALEKHLVCEPCKYVMVWQ